MTQTKRIKRQIHGVLLLDKPLGFSSNQALQKVKWLFQAAKAGHTGTLDPMATGVLPICFGEATKFAQRMTDADKTYVASMKLGITTTTGDVEGEVISQHSVNVELATLTHVCQQFLGEIVQLPPMFSALKVDGKPLYDYAREGLEVERTPRKITIFDLKILHFSGDELVIEVKCSKGTYIRTLAEDIGRMLGCGAHLTGLRRTETAGFTITECITLPALEQYVQEQAHAAIDALLTSVDRPLMTLPSVNLTAVEAKRFLLGQRLKMQERLPIGELRVYDEHDHFLGLAEHAGNQVLAPKRIISELVSERH